MVLSELCEQILDHCCAKTVSHYGKNSCDNMTIIIIWFDHSDPGTARSETGGSIKSSSQGNSHYVAHNFNLPMLNQTTENHTSLDGSGRNFLKDDLSQSR